MCVCVCVCAREKERGGDGGRERGIDIMLNKECSFTILLRTICNGKE